MKNMNLQQLKTLYDVAVAFKKLKPWTYMYEDQIFAVTHPKTNKQYYCSISGTLGQDVALTLYLNEQSFMRIREVMQDTKGEMPQVVLMDHIMHVEALKCSFEHKDNLYDEEQERMRQLGLRFRGDNAWPACRVLAKGKVPQMLVDAEQGELLTYALQEAVRLVPQVRKGKITVPSICEGDKMLYLDADDNQGSMPSFAIKQFKQAEEVIRVPYIYEDELMLRKISNLKTGGMTLECGTILVPEPMGYGMNQSLPTLFMAYNNKEKNIFHGDAVDGELAPIYEERARWIIEHFAEAMLVRNIKPRYIKVGKDEDFDMLEDFCKKAKIDLKKTKYSFEFVEVFGGLIGALIDCKDDMFDEDDAFMQGEASLEEQHDGLVLFLAMATSQFINQKEAAAYTKEEGETAVAHIEAFSHTVLQMSGQLPDQWTPETIAFMFNEGFARYVSMPQEVVETIPRDLSAFISFLGRIGLYKTKEVKALLSAIVEHTPALMRSTMDKSLWNPAKRAGMAALEDDIDPNDSQGMFEYLKNELGMAAMLGLKGNITKNVKIGRNDPCPCGSGKKFKKCCGSKLV